MFILTDLTNIYAMESISRSTVLQNSDISNIILKVMMMIMMVMVMMMF